MLYYWSSTTDRLDATFGMYFTYGHDFGNQYKSTSNYVLAMRGQRQSVNFVDNGNSTVTDMKTGLMWQQATGNNGVVMTWKVALGYCENLSLASYTNWRLPNIRELASITDFTRSNPAINIGYFPDTKLSASYWSSSSDVKDIENIYRSAHEVHYQLGFVGSDIKGDSNYVRCVRSSNAAPAATIAGDIDSSGRVDLKDAVLGLQITGGLRTTGFSSKADVNNDGRIGLEEVVYTLQILAGISGSVDIIGYVAGGPPSGSTVIVIVLDKNGNILTSGNATTNAEGFYIVTISKSIWNNAYSVTAKVQNYTARSLRSDEPFQTMMLKGDYERVGNLNITPLSATHYQLMQKYVQLGMDNEEAYRRAVADLTELTGSLSGQTTDGVPLVFSKDLQKYNAVLQIQAQTGYTLSQTISKIAQDMSLEDLPSGSPILNLSAYQKSAPSQNEWVTIYYLFFGM